MFMPEKRNNILPPTALLVLNKLSCNENANNAYVVGGGVRDLLLGKGIYDLDIVIPDAGKVAEQIAKEVPGTLVTMGETKGKVNNRFVFSDGGYERFQLGEKSFNKTNIYKHFWLDVAEIDSEGIKQDLKKRDFTVNSMALPLKTFISYLDGELSLEQLRGSLVDCFNGKKDLYNKVLREVSNNIIIKDPLRLWRVWRQAAELDFTIASSLLNIIIRDSHLCKELPGERVRSELVALLSLPGAGEWLVKAGNTGLVESQFPAMASLKDCEQGGYHFQDAWEHSFQVVVELENIIAELDEFFPSEKQQQILLEWLNEGTNLAILKLAALFHDIGKPLVKEQDENGKIRFFNHEKAGLTLVENISESLRLSRREADLLSLMVSRHLQVQDIVSRAARRNQLKFWHLHGEDAIGLLLLGCADRLSKAAAGINADYLQKFIYQHSPEFLKVWAEEVSPVLKAKPLLNGRDIMREFSLPQGEQVGKLKEAIVEAQLEGKISNRQEALDLVTKLLQNNE